MLQQLQNPSTELAIRGSTAGWNRVSPALKVCVAMTGCSVTPLKL